ncbi:MAG: hypothetical protein ABFR95_11325 [Actinomycetota bacterium]
MRQWWIALGVSILLASSACATTESPPLRTATSSTTVPSVAPCPPISTPLSETDGVFDMWHDGVIAIATDGSYIVRYDPDPADKAILITTYDARRLREETIAIDLEGSVKTLIMDGTIATGPDQPAQFLMNRLYADQSLFSWGADVNGAISGTKDERETLATTDPWSGAEITVDTDSLIPVLRVEIDNGDRHVIDEASIEIIPFSRADLAVTLGHEEDGYYWTQDFGFEAAAFDELAELSGYTPLVPTWLPGGFTLSQIAFASDPGSYLFGSRDAVALVYRNRSSHITVTVRPTNPEQDWQDPWDKRWDNPPPVDGTLTHTSPTGVFTIVPAFEVETTYDWETHALGESGDLFVTINGAVSPDDVVRMIDSLAPAPTECGY